MTTTEHVVPSMSAKTECAHDVTVRERLSKYGYAITDGPGLYFDVPLEELTVDESYQRDSRKRSIVRKIAREWSWISCGALIVAERNSVFRVIDGGGRTEAARLRGDIPTLPCMVYPCEDIRAEAEAFVRINKDRTAIKPAERFKAELAQGNPIALKVQRLIADTGRSLSLQSGASSVACVDTLMSIVKMDEKVVQDIWPLIKVLCDGHPIPKRLVDGLFYMQKRAVEGQSLLKKPWSVRLTRIGHSELMKGIHDATNYHERGGRPVYAEGITKKLNSGLRNNAWILPSSSDE